MEDLELDCVLSGTQHSSPSSYQCLGVLVKNLDQAALVVGRRLDALFLVALACKTCSCQAETKVIAFVGIVCGS